MLLAIMVLEMLSILSFKIPPPLLAELPEMVELMILRVPELQIPPPKVVAVLLEMVELVMVAVDKLKMAPPALLLAVLLERVELLRVKMPWLKIPPPLRLTAKLLEMVELEMERVPRLLKAAPLLEEYFAPETVTPEMVRLPPVAMLKIWKLRFALIMLEELSKPLIIKEEEPGPLMVRVPAVPPPAIGVLALIMVGSEALTVLLRELRVIVPVILKLMMSSPAVALAKVIASLSEIKVSPELTISKVVSTVIVAGLILSSNLRSSSRGEPEALRAFLFGERLKNLRKAFKIMKRVPIQKPK
jgi:hypothetical protein